MRFVHSLIAALLLTGLMMPTSSNADDQVIMRPKANGTVNGLDQVIGRNFPGKTPVVLVRTAGEKNAWLVQHPTTFVNAKYFRSKIAFGNLAGENYEIVVLMFESPAKASVYQPGREFKNLPKGVYHTPTHRVSARSTDPVLFDGDDREGIIKR